MDGWKARSTKGTKGTTDHYEVQRKGSSIIGTKKKQASSVSSSFIINLEKALLWHVGLMK